MCTVEKYLNKPLKDCTCEDLMCLNRKKLLALFRLLDAPDMAEMEGEYRAIPLDGGNVVNTFLTWLYLYFTWGSWQHKAFHSMGDRHGHGYNTFITTQPVLYENFFIAGFMKWLHIAKSIAMGSPPQRMARIMLNKTTMVSSVFDGKPSFQLSYRDYNTFFTNTMTDEVRKVNDRLYLGIGRLSISFGKYNPAPFALMGPPDPWMGPDIQYPD